MNWAYALFALVIIAAAADVATTTYGVEHSDRFIEGNQLLSDVMDQHGTIIGHVTLKAAALALYVGLAAIIPSKYSVVVFIPPALLWSGAAIWNLTIII